MREQQRLPLLMTSHGEDSAKQSFYDLVENQYHTTCIPILRNKSVLCSIYGWLLLLDRTDAHSQGQCCLWNPTSLEVIQLPLVENPCPYNICFLSKPPTEPDCFIVFNPVCLTVQTVYRIQDNVLFELHFLKEGYRVMSMVTYQGMVYGIVRPSSEMKYEFVTVHMVGDKLETKALLIDGKMPWEVPQLSLSWIPYSMHYLIESPCGNELLLVTKMFHDLFVDNGVHFRVFRVDVGKMESEELDNLDGRTIFISNYGNGFCRYSESFGAAIKPNSIYYTNMNGVGMHVYDLDDRSIITSFPCPEADIDPNTAVNYWVDMTDIPMKNSLYYNVS